jgi:CDP-4-dehydro-6-deoxyglucose reductase, E3
LGSAVRGIIKLQPSFAYRVVEINQLTPTHLQLILKPIAASMVYRAGQYLYLRYPNGEYSPFSIANAPAESNLIELHIRTALEDLATQQFVANLSFSSQVTVAGPFGDCCYETKTSGPLLLLAAGTGFAPAKAIIEELITEEDLEKDCRLYWIIKRPSDVYIPDLPAYWQRLLPNFHYTLISTESKRTHRRSILEAVKRDFIELSHCQVYVFGPRALAIESLQEFRSMGLQKDFFYTDMLTKDQIDLL